MFAKFKRNRARHHTQDIHEEVLSICRDQQFRSLALPGRIQKDIGIDCGCDDMSLPILPPRTL